MARQRDTLLTANEVSNYYKWSIWARPLTMHSLNVVMVVIAMTTCYMVISGRSSLADADGILMTIAGAIFPILGALILGKSWERSRGVSEETTVVPTASQSVTTTPNANPTLGVTQTTTTLVAEGLADPLDILKSMNLDEYIPKVADDTPDI